MTEQQLPPRPAASRRGSEAIRSWLTWFGPARTALTAVGAVVLGAAAWWLVRVPPPPVEAGLPVASAPSSPAEVPTTPSGPLGVGDEPGRVIVHVAGAVERPGVYELADGARVLDAVDAAGGARGDAELDGLNLAAPTVDGTRIYVPVAGEVDPAAVSADGGVGAVPVDLNRATVEQLQTLPGIGPATAAAIVDDRERNGPFASVDDLERVAGIGPSKLAALHDLVTV